MRVKSAVNFVRLGSGGRIRTSNQKINNLLHGRRAAPERTRESAWTSFYLSGQSVTIVGASERSDVRNARMAYRWLLAAVVLSLLAFGVGAAWDRAWHTRNPFEDFFSPPHLFIYTTHFLATLALAKIAFTAELRRHFGRPMHMPILGEMPAALIFAGGGFGVIALAGFFDAIWHSAFGLDETAWSLPHSMLGSGILLSLLGFVSARMALSTDRPLARWAPALFAVLILSTMVGVLLGPLDNYRSLEHVRAVARIPILAATPEFQHTARIHEQWNLTRLNPLFIPLSAFVIGIGLNFARQLVGKTWAFLVVALLATLLSSERDTAEYLGIQGDPKNTSPIPYLVPALAFVLFARVRLSDAWAWRIAGLLYGIAAGLVWPSGPLPLVAAAPAMAIGAPAGGLIADIVRSPDLRVWRLLAVLGVALPAVTGVIDLFLRSRTP